MTSAALCDVRLQCHQSVFTGAPCGGASNQPGLHALHALASFPGIQHQNTTVVPLLVLLLRCLGCWSTSCAARLACSHSPGAIVGAWGSRACGKPLTPSAAAYEGCSTLCADGQRELVADHRMAPAQLPWHARYVWRFDVALMRLCVAPELQLAESGLHREWTVQPPCEELVGCAASLERPVVVVQDHFIPVVCVGVCADTPSKACAEALSTAARGCVAAPSGRGSG